jgi:hypothetical protein
MLICDGLSTNLCDLKMIEYVLNSLELLMSHPRLRLFFGAITCIFNSIFLKRTCSNLPSFLSKLNFKLISLAHISLFLVHRWLLLASSNILPYLFGRRCQHILEFGGALFIIFCQRSNVERYVLDAQALIKHLFELLIAIEDLSGDLVSNHFLTTFSLDTIDYNYGLVGLVQESKKDFFRF